LTAAGERLGIRAVHVLSFPDGNLRWRGGPKLRDAIRRIVRRHQPDAVITFDEDGLYWHADHVAVHEETSRALSGLGDDAPALYYVTMAPGAMRSVVRRASEKRWVPPTAGAWSIDPSAYGVATKAPTFTVDVRPWLARKLTALQCHRSQFGAINPFSLLSPSEASDWLGFEYFRRAPIPGRLEGGLEPFADRGAQAACICRDQRTE
jgi:LmbE family N-acetylglucosaminyl deacetylase